MKPPFIRSLYNYDTEKASDESAYKETMPSLTVQSQSLDTDINEIMRRVGQGAAMPQGLYLPEYGDYTEITDYRSALEAIRAGQESFMKYPAHIRAAFQNDPQVFLEACSNPANLPELVKLGIAVERKPPESPNATPPHDANRPVQQPGGTGEPRKDAPKPPSTPTQD